MVFRQRRRAVAIVAPAAIIATGLGALMATSAPAVAAGVDSVTSPTGMVTVSGPAPIVAGTASAYTVTVTNEASSPFAGPAGVVVAGTMPAGITISRITGCARLGGNQGTSLLCSMPNLAPGASETMTLSLLASAAGDFQIPLGASAEIADLETPGAFEAIGDSVTLPVSVQPAPTDIQVTGSSNNGSPPVGGTFNYTFQVKDNGPQAASGVTFEETTSSENLCRGGAAFRTRFDVAVGMDLDICIPLSQTGARRKHKDDDFAAQGRVVHVRDSETGERLVGVQFLNNRFRRLFVPESAA